MPVEGHPWDAREGEVVTAPDIIVVIATLLVVVAVFLVYAWARKDDPE